MALLSNAVTPCVTPTYDGSGQGMHPCVIDFLAEYGLPTWAGYRYWMAMTPYPGGDASKENPSLLCSADGQTWVVPAGLANPIDTRDNVATHLNDPFMVYDPSADNLRVYYGEAGPAFGFALIMRTVGADMSVSAATVCISGASLSEFFGPTVWRESATSWHMWHAGIVSPDTVLCVYYRTSADGITWSGPSPAFLQRPSGNWPWHLGGKPNYAEQRMDFLVACSTVNNASSVGEKLIFVSCDFADPTHLFSPYADLAIALPVAGRWDESSLYQASLVIRDSDESYLYDIWYSGRNSSAVWHTALVKGALLGATASAYAACLTAFVMVLAGGAVGDVLLTQASTDDAGAVIGKTTPNASVTAYLASDTSRATPKRKSTAETDGDWSLYVPRGAEWTVVCALDRYAEKTCEVTT